MALIESETDGDHTQTKKKKNNKKKEFTGSDNRSVAKKVRLVNFHRDNFSGKGFITIYHAGFDLCVEKIVIPSF